MFGLLWICSKTLLIIFWSMFWIDQSLKGLFFHCGYRFTGSCRLYVVSLTQVSVPDDNVAILHADGNQPGIPGDSRGGDPRRERPHNVWLELRVWGKRRIRWLRLSLIHVGIELFFTFSVLHSFSISIQIKCRPYFCQWKLNYIIYVSLEWKHWYSKYMPF